MSMGSLEAEESGRYRRLIDAVDGIIWEAKPDLTFTFVSQQSERILGYPPARWLEEPGFWASHLHPDDRARALTFCQEQTKCLASHNFEYRMIAADGREVWLRDLVTVESDSGKPIKVCGIMVDITRLRIAEADLQQSEERFRCLAEATSDGAVVHENGIILFANQNQAKLFGYELKELEGMNVLNLTAPESKALLEEKLAGASKPAYQAVLLRKDGSTFWAEINARDTVYRGRPVRIATVRDITEIRNLESQRERVLQQERAAKEEAERNIRIRDEFLAIASHELKTPLTPLKLELQLQRRYLRDLGLPASPKTDMLFRAIDHADREYERLARLVDDLLDASRISGNKLILDKSSCNLTEMVKQIIERFARQIERSGSKVQAKLEPGVVGHWDAARIEQVATNLIQNAAKYGGGELIQVEVKRAGHAALLTVRDHGIGIDPQNQQAIFERFVRVAPVGHYGGLGLGLYIAKKIVDAHEGKLSVSSTLGQGSTFTLELPIAAASELPAEAQIA